MEVVETLEGVLLELVTLALEEICVDDIEVERLVDEVEANEDELMDTMVEDEEDEDTISDMLAVLEVSVLELEAFVLVLDSALELDDTLELELDREVWGDEVGVVAKD